MRRKIAPVLSALIQDELDRVKTPPPTREKAGDAQVLRIAEAELRAVAEVVSAARWDHDDDGAGCPRWAPCRVCRALARLDRLSRPQRAGRGR